VSEWLPKCDYAMKVRKTVIALNEDFGHRPPNVFAKGPHKLLHNSLRAGHHTYIYNIIVSGYITFYKTNNFFKKYILFSLLTKCLCSQMKWLHGP